MRVDFEKKITVVAVSDGVSDTGRRSWICLRPREYHVIKRCSDSGKIKCDYTVDDTVAIEIKTLIDKYDLTADDILRHYDCGGKKCPKYYVEHEDVWERLRCDVSAYKDDVRKNI